MADLTLYSPFSLIDTWQKILTSSLCSGSLTPLSETPMPLITLFILDLDINTPPGPSLQSNKYSPMGLRTSSLLSLPPFILEKIERQSWTKQA